MSILTLKKKQQHNLLLNYLKNFHEIIVNLRTNEWLKKKEHRNYAEGKIRNVNWFEELPQGCLVYFEGHKEPMRDLVWQDALNTAYIWKKAVVMFLEFINGKEGFKKKSIFEKVFILLSLIKQYDFYVKFLHHALYDYIYDDTRKWSPPVFEIYKVFPEELGKERDIICFFLGDQAYKFRMQDILPELNKEAFKKNPTKELKRLMDLIISRDSEGTMRNKWRMLKRLITPVYYYIKFFRRKMYKQLMQMAADINLEALKPTKEDIYWMNDMNSYYNFRGISQDVRKLLNL